MHVPVTQGALSMSERSTAIVMATFNAEPELFRRQVQSIRSQSSSLWHCFIHDDSSQPGFLAQMTSILRGDPRFTLTVNSEHVGFYHNFERALGRVPKGYDFIALSDQDDYWAPMKLQRLVGAMADGVTLAYSDMRTVTRRGDVLSSTYWVGRRNNWSDLAALLVANSVSGAAAVFRSRLLPVLLPFPPEHPSSFHDQWLAVVALATGCLSYVPAPLVDYVQHGGNVIGHANTRARSGWRSIEALSPNHLEEVWEDDGCRLVETAATLLERCRDDLSASKRAVLERVAGLASSRRSLLWLAGETMRRLPDGSITMGLERRLLAAAVWYRIAYHCRRHRYDFGSPGTVPL